MPRIFQSLPRIVLLIFLFVACEKVNDELQSDVLVFPAGRSFLNTSLIKVEAGLNPVPYNLVYDSCGGYWLFIERAAFNASDDLKITISRRKDNDFLFSEAFVNEEWLSSSYYINSDNEIFAERAGQLTTGLTSNVEKAKAIQHYVIGHIKLRIYKDSFLDKASETYKLGYGTCMNFSRLYVALCRAAKIPARTVWGVVYGFNNDHIYDYHHQWAEIMDESGYWHPCDFNYTTGFDLADIRYLDLIYAPEENQIIQDRSKYQIMLKKLDYYHNYPVTLTSRLGFRLVSDNRPDSMVIEYAY